MEKTKNINKISSVQRFFLVASLCFLAFNEMQISVAQVTSVFPLPQEIQADRTTQIEINFSEAINPDSVDLEDLFVFGRWSGVANGNISFDDDNAKLTFLPDKPFMAGEWITVALSKNIEDVNGSQLATGFAWNFWAKASPGSFEYELIDDISSRLDGEGRVRSYGAYAGDFNQDGYSDLMIPNEDANDIRIFLNDGSGRYGDFTIYTIPDGAVPSTNEGSDFNRDGVVDFAVGNTGNDLISVWMGLEDGEMTHAQNARADENIRGLCVLDLDGDAVMDIVTANRTGAEDGGSISLLMNDGIGNFLAPINQETESAGETACASIDANGDGVLDVFIGAYGSNEVLLLLGDGEGGLVLSDSKDVGANPWMLAAGDLNGDGFADAVSSNVGNGTVSVIFGNGDGTLQTARHYQTGQFPLAIDLGDLDGDGDLDVVTSNFSSNDYTVLENNGAGVLSRKLTLPATTAASCTILHDRDNDGDLDITAIDELADRIFLFDNVTTATSIEHELPEAKFDLLGNYPNPFSNRTAIELHVGDIKKAEVAIYNVLGQRVRAMTLDIAGPQKIRITWDGTNDEGIPLKSGIYFYSVTAGKISKTQSVLLLR